MLLLISCQYCIMLFTLIKALFISLPTLGAFLSQLIFLLFAGRICSGTRTDWSHYQHCVRRQDHPKEPNHKKASYAKGKEIALSLTVWRNVWHLGAFNYLLIRDSSILYFYFNPGSEQIFRGNMKEHVNILISLAFVVYEDMWSIYTIYRCWLIFVSH